MLTSPTRAELKRLLQNRNQHPEQAVTIDRQIQATFEQECAILVLDMAGFSRLTLKHGIIYFLAMVQRMEAIAAPIATQHQGKCIKQEADNLFVAFPTVQSAIAAAMAIFQAFAHNNTALPDDKDLYASVGIGYGKTLVVGDHDLFGCEMNLACKLGEDLARRGEILLTEAAYAQINATGADWERLVLSISKLELVAYKFRQAPTL